VFLAGCVEGRCHYQRGDASAAEQVALARDLVTQMRRTMPIEQWHLCAVDHTGIGHRLRSFCDRVDEAQAGATAQLAAVDGVRELVLPVGER
jgi:coenzyme F420-reducing hydrogenase delta subunit